MLLMVNLQKRSKKLGVNYKQIKRGGRWAIGGQKMNCKYCAGSVNRIRKLPFKSRKTPDRYRFFECSNCGTAWAEPRPEIFENPPRLVHKGKIHWKCIVPESFPCFLCKGSGADWSVHIGKGPIVIKLVLCESCAELSVVKITDRVYGGGAR